MKILFSLDHRHYFLTKDNLYLSVYLALHYVPFMRYVLLTFNKCLECERQINGNRIAILLL